MNREHSKGYEAETDPACQKYLTEFFQAVIHETLIAPVRYIIITRIKKKVKLGLIGKAFCPYSDGVMGNVTVELARLMRERRISKGLSAERMGALIKPRNPGRGIEFMRAVENGTMPFPPRWIMEILAAALSLTREDIYRAQQLDFRALDRRLDPLEIVAAVGSGEERSETVPPGMEMEDAVRMLGELALREGARCVLRVSAVREFRCGPDGAVREVYRLPPSSGLEVRGGRLVPLDVGFDRVR